MKDASGKDVIRGYIKGAPDQLLARAVSAHGPDGTEVPVARCATPTSPRTSASARMGLRVMATGQKDFDPATFDPNADLLPASMG